MNFRLGLAAGFLAGCAFLTPASGAGTSDDAWNLMKTIAGEWKGDVSDGKVTSLKYELISNGSAILETFKGPDGGAFMITVYHRDGADLMATHYCAIGNQPRMRAKAPAAGSKTIDFRFLDVSNLSAPGADHISGVAITFKDPDHIDEVWAHRAHGKEDHDTVFRLTRMKTAK